MRSLIPSSLGLITLFLLNSQSVYAAVWSIDPQVEFRLSSTDNLRLAEQGAEESDVITSVAPGVSINAEGDRVEFDLDYRYEKVYYKENSDLDNSYQQFLSRLHSNVVRELIFLDLNGSITQQIIDPREPSTVDSIFVTANQTDATSYSVSPYINTRNGRGQELLVKPTYTVNTYDEVESLDNENYQYELMYRQSNTDAYLSWLLRATSTQVEYEDGDRAELNAVELEARMRLYRRLSLLAGVGYEDNEYDQAAGGGEIDGRNWFFGISWVPNRRTSVEMRIGERFFGKTGSLNLTRRGRYSTINLNYEESIIPGGQVLLIEDAELLPVNQVIPDAEVSITERISASYIYDKSKLRTTIAVSSEKRELQRSLSTEETVNGNINILARLTNRTSAEITGNFINNKYITQNRDDKDIISSFSIIHQLGRDIVGELQAQRVERKSDLAEDSYLANVIGATLTIEF